MSQSNIVCEIIIDDIVKRHLTGFVRIISGGELIIKYAYIEISGIAKCELVLEKQVIKFPRFYKKGTTTSGEEEFYFTRHTLCGGSLAHKHKGVEGYEFTCGWPTRLPATWSGEHGLIKYIGKVTIIEITGAFIHSQELVVLSKRDLTLEKHLLNESVVNVHRPFHFMGHLGNINVSVWTPFSGIAVGQSIPVLCSIDNNSNFPFGSIIFVLTRIEIYRTKTPVTCVKNVRTDICRVPKMVNILRGKTDYYCVLETDENIFPTNQFHKCTTCQMIYEVWVSVQGAFPRYGPCGYPNVDTPGIPIIIGTEPICQYNINKITSNIMSSLLYTQKGIEIESLPPDEEVEELLNTVEEELDDQTIENLNRQLEEDVKAIKELTEDKSDL